MAFLSFHIKILSKEIINYVKKTSIVGTNCALWLCADLVEYIKNILQSEQFALRHKNSSSSFTRIRKLPFQMLILFLLNLIKGSYQDELDYFFKALSNSEVAARVVTKVAFCKARLKVNHEAFIELNSHLVEFFYSDFKTKKWHGLNLLAIDGSTARLPKTQNIIEHFGVLEAREGEEYTMARTSQLFDVLNKISIDAIISPSDIGERELLKQHLLKLLPNDLLLLDRGYSAYWVFALIVMLGGNFCARVSPNNWSAIKKFHDSGKMESIITLSPSRDSIKQCTEMGLDLMPLQLRVIRVDLETGESEFLLTSLTDDVKYPLDLFPDLYHHRWPVEEDYKTMKCWVEVENFTGKSALSVYQDFHARVFSKNMTSAISFPTDAVIKEQSKHKKYEDQINFAQALSKTKDVIVLLFKKTKSKTIDLISQLHDIFIKTTEPIRPGRKFKREPKRNKRVFNMNYKPVR